MPDHYIESVKAAERSTFGFAIRSQCSRTCAPRARLKDGAIEFKNYLVLLVRQEFSLGELLIPSPGLRYVIYLDALKSL